MAQIPTIDNNPSVQPGPMVDGASIYDGYSKMFQQISAQTAPIAQNLADESAQSAGAQAGQNLNFKPGIEIGQASKEFNEAALQANRYQAGADILTNINNFKQQALQNVSQNSLDNYQASIQGYSKGLLSTVPAQNRPYVQKLLTYKATEGQQHIQTALNNRLVQQGAQQLQSTYNTYSNEMVQANQQNNGQAGASFYGQTKNILDKAFQGGFLTAKEHQGYVTQLNQAYYKSQVSGQLNQIHQNGVQTTAEKLAASNQFIADVGTNKDLQANFSPFQIHALQTNLQTQQNQWKQQQGLNAAALNQLMKKLNQQAYNGSQVDENELNTLHESLPPAQWDNFNQKYQTNQAVGSVVNQVKTASLSDGASSISELQDALSKTEDPDSVAILNKGIKDAQLTYRDKLNDPVKYAVQNQAYQNAVQAHQEDPGDNPQSGVYQKLIDLQKAQGYSQQQIHIMSNAQAKGIAQQMNNASPDQLLALYQQMESNYGANSQYLAYAMQDLHRNGLKTAPAVMSAMASNPNTKQGVGDFSTALQTPLTKWSGILNDQQSGQFRQVQQNVTAALQPTIKLFTNQGLSNPNQFANLQNATTQLASYYVWKDGMSPSQAAEQAANQTFVGHYNKGVFNSHSFALPLTDENGNAIEPSNANAIATMKLNDAVNDENVVTDPDYPTEFGPIEQRRNYIQSLKSGAYWANQGSMGLVLMNELGKPVMVKKGNQVVPYSLPFSEIADPESQSNQRLQIAPIDRTKFLASSMVGGV